MGVRWVARRAMAAGWRRSGPSQKSGTALHVVDDCRETDLQTGLRESAPSHVRKAVAAFPRSKDLLNPVDRPIPGLKAGQRSRLITAPHAGDGDAQGALP